MSLIERMVIQNNNMQDNIDSNYAFFLILNYYFDLFRFLTYLKGLYTMYY